jgi:hypothetical protein|eukprot:COSAG01_NODE_622_length_14779_cov_69.589305_14_plen_245_part_00
MLTAAVALPAQTDMNSTRRFGTCLAFTCPTDSAGPGRAVDGSTTHSLCLLSRAPAFDMARALLRQLYSTLLTTQWASASAGLQAGQAVSVAAKQQRGGPHFVDGYGADPFSSLVAALVMDLPCPLGVELRLALLSATSDTGGGAGDGSADNGAALRLTGGAAPSLMWPPHGMSCQLSSARAQPTADTDLLLLFRCLSLRHIIHVISCLCVERSVRHPTPPHPLMRRGPKRTRAPLAQAAVFPRN